MGVTMSRNFGGYGGNSKRRVAQFENCIASAMDSAMKVGAQAGTERIETSGTGWQGRAGRVDKGDMKDSFEGALVEKNAKRIVGQLGWLLESPYYAKYQDLGFDHTSGKHVEGMFAVRDAGEEAWDEFNKLADACIRGVFG